MPPRRDPLERVIDAAVATPLCLAIAARDAVPLIARAGRRRIVSLVRRVGLEHGTVSVVDATAASGRDRAEAQREPATLCPTSYRTEPALECETDMLAIDDYDHLAARQVVDRLSSLTLEELALIQQYELAHRRRRTILGGIERLRP